MSAPEVVLRLLRGAWTRDPAERDRFAEEASAAARVPPFCAARIVDAGVAGDYAFLVSEYVAGRSLLEIVSDDGPFAGPELEAVAIGSVTGLGSVHQAGLVHGNFGPEYIVLSAAGPRLIEYGITPPYGLATPSADMLAWGQTIVFAALGRPPATYADLDALPSDLREPVAQCLSGDPALRPSARSIVVDLLGAPLPMDQALAEGARRAAVAARVDDRPAADPVPPGGGPAGAGRAGPGPTAQRRPARRRGMLLPTIVAAIVVVAVVAFVIVEVLGSSAPGGQAQDRTSAPPASTSPASPKGSRPASPAPSNVTVPTAFSGSWAGQARQENPPLEFQVKLSLPAGVSDGSVSYSSASFTCVGQLSPDSVASNRLTLDQGITSGRKTCANGTVTLTAARDGVLRFTFRGKTGPVATGTLTKT